MNLNLTWHEKFRFLNEIDPNIALKMDARNGWYLSTQIRVVDDIGASNSIHNLSIAKTPEYAVNDFWNRLINIGVGCKLVLGLNDKVGFRWEGSRWLKV